MEIVGDKAAYEAFGADDLVLVEDEHHFVWGVDADIPYRLGGDLVLVENIDFNYAFGTEIDHILARVTTAKVKDDFLVRVGFWVLA